MLPPKLSLNVSVDVGVPEQGLVTIAPEELLLSDVLVVVLHRPLLVREVSHVLSVLSVLQLNVDNWDSSQSNGWECNDVDQLLPSGSNALRVVDLLLISLLEGLTSLLVDLAGRESCVVEELGRGVMRVESSEAELLDSLKHVGVYFFLFFRCVINDWMRKCRGLRKVGA